LKLPVTVILLTLNEEYHLRQVLPEICSWASDVFIVDSLSTDATIDLALEHGAQIVQRPFTTFGDQWNWAVQHAPKNPWTMKLDPDERVSPELLEEMRQRLAAEPGANGFRFRLRFWFMGNPLNQYLQDVRLWRTGTLTFSDSVVNEAPVVEGEIEEMRGLIEHLDSRDLHHWWEKQNLYSTMRAIEMVKKHKFAVKPRLLGDSRQRRMFIKQFFFRMPLRYTLLRLYLGIVKGAFFCGYPGRTWAYLRTVVYRMAEQKAWEIRKTGRIPPVPRAPHGDYDPRVPGVRPDDSVEGASSDSQPIATRSRSDAPLS
jgi:glycosyltransferase involved in cell wall biosynthesis